MNSTPVQTTQNNFNFCDSCGKAFSNQVNLKNHILTIHEKKFPFKCTHPGCEKQYSIQTRLNIHMRTHLSNKPYKCDTCQKSFAMRGDLKTHQKFHSNERPFKCTYCDKAYKTNEHLKDHIQIQHFGIKKYHCDICQKSFGKSSALKAHLRTHTGEKNFKCELPSCEKYFSEKGNMLMHYKRHLKKLEKKSNGKEEQKHLSTASTSNEKISQDEVSSNNNSNVFDSVKKTELNFHEISLDIQSNSDFVNCVFNHINSNFDNCCCQDNNELIENDSSKISLIKLQSEEDKHEELNTQTEINFFGCDMDEDYNKNNVSFTLEDEKQQQFFF